MKVLAFFVVFLSVVSVSFAPYAKVISFNNPLVDAADRGEYNKVLSIMKSSHFVDSKGSFGTTPLMRSSFHGHNKIVDLLLKNGADPNIADIGGATALHFAARKGNVKVMQSLLAYDRLHHQFVDILLAQ